MNRQHLIFQNGVLLQENFRIEIETGTVYDKIYHVAKPLNAHDKWSGMMSWMIETFGPTAKDGVWTAGERWYVNNARFWFREEPDLVLFLIRWQN